jgi:hypothetical protein
VLIQELNEASWEALLEALFKVLLMFYSAGGALGSYRRRQGDSGGR